MLIRVWMPFLVSTMLIRWWKELNVIEGNACNYFHPTWKSTSCAMTTKVSQIASWVPRGSLPWAQCKRWIPIRSMGCVHTHWRMLAIEGWGSPSCVWNAVKKIGKDNRNVGETDRIISQTLILGDAFPTPWRTQMLVQVKDSGRKKSWGTFLSSQHLRGRGACWSSGMGLGRIDKLTHSHRHAHNTHKVVSA
jgi:hypothetical protein